MPGSCYSNLAFVLDFELHVDPHGPELASQSPQRPGQSGLYTTEGIAHQADRWQTLERLRALSLNIAPNLFT